MARVVYDHVTKRFGDVFAVNDVSLDIRRGNNVQHMVFARPFPAFDATDPVDMSGDEVAADPRGERSAAVSVDCGSDQNQRLSSPNAQPAVPETESESWNVIASVSS